MSKLDALDALVGVPEDVLLERLNRRDTVMGLWDAEEAACIFAQSNGTARYTYAVKQPGGRPRRMRWESLNVGAHVWSSRSPVRFRIIASAHLRSDVRMGCVMDDATSSLVLCFTGVKNVKVALSDGYRIVCQTEHVAARWYVETFLKEAGVPGADAQRAAKALPSDATVHGGISQIAMPFATTKAIRSTMHHMGMSKRLVVTGLSLGGSLAHMVGLPLECWARHKRLATPRLYIAHGAPRAGNSSMAAWWGELRPLFGHANLACADETGVDVVNLMPLRRQGYASEKPVVLAYGKKRFVSDSRGLVADNDVWNAKSAVGLCLGSLRFMNGYGHLHKFALHPLFWWHGEKKLKADPTQTPFEVE